MSSQSNNLGAAALIAMRSVVRIHAEGFTEENQQSILDPRFAVPMQWTGSGFFVDLSTNDGQVYILTNAHVARNATSLKCLTLITSEELFTLQIVSLVESLDPDVALLRLPETELLRYRAIAGVEPPLLKLADSQSLVRGIDIKAIGYPLGMAEPNTSGGEISNFISGDFNFCERVVTDASINPGNSGGPAVMRGGLVVGINTATIIGANNIGFITPASTCHIALSNMLHKNQAGLAHLGARFQKNSEANAAHLKMAQAEGVILTHIFKHSMAEAAGLKRLDVLLAINGFRFDRHGLIHHNDMGHRAGVHDIVRRIPLGQLVRFHIWRDGAEMSIEACARTFPALHLHSQPIVSKRRYCICLGMILQEASYEILQAIRDVYEVDSVQEMGEETSTRPYLVITHISLGTDAEELQLETGDIIEKINGHKVFSLNGFQQAIQVAIGESNQETLLIETHSGCIGALSLARLREEPPSITELEVPRMHRHSRPRA